MSAGGFVQGFQEAVEEEPWRWQGFDLRPFLFGERNTNRTILITPLYIRIIYGHYANIFR